MAGHDDVIVDSLLACFGGENDHVSLAIRERSGSERDDGCGNMNVGGRKVGEDGRDVGGTVRGRNESDMKTRGRWKEKPRREDRTFHP